MEQSDFFCLKSAGYMHSVIPCMYTARVSYNQCFRQSDCMHDCILNITYKCVHKNHS